MKRAIMLLAGTALWLAAMAALTLSVFPVS